MTARTVIAGLLLGLACVAAVAQERHQPVPDEPAAIALADKKLIPIYGKKQIESERPFKAKLEGLVWHVSGYLPPDSDGGVAEIWIDKHTGKVLKTTHGK